MSITETVAQAHEEGAWEMFDLISSAYWGKRYYFRQDNNLVYSRESGKYMSFDDAVAEFIKHVGD